MYPERLTNQITWAKPDPPPNALHTAFTHSKAVGASRPTDASLAYPKVPSDGCQGGWVRREELGLYGNVLSVLLLLKILDYYRML